VARRFYPADVPRRRWFSYYAGVFDTVELKRALRRLAVVAEQRLVGIVSIGDLAVERDRTSALADISAASPNT